MESTAKLPVTWNVDQQDSSELHISKSYTRRNMERQDPRRDDRGDHRAYLGDGYD